METTSPPKSVLQDTIHTAKPLSLPFSLQATRWRGATAAAIHINQIIVNEKSLRGIMSSCGIIVHFHPPIAIEIYMERPECFPLSFGIQDLLPGN